MDVYLFNYAKKRNSVNAPDVSGMTPNDLKLKAGCSVLKPVLELYGDIMQYGNVIRSNYAYIPDFHRYYYITNWTLDATLAIVSLEVDVLASYASHIKASTQYVLRSGSLYDGNIVDGKYPLKTTAPTKSVGSTANPLQPAANDYGCFVLGIVNKSMSLSGCITYYVMSYLVFMTFCQNLFNLQTQWGSGDTSLSDGAKKVLTDPFQYVVSCLWFPYSTADFNYQGLVTSVTGSIPVGYDNVTITGTAYEFDTSILNIQFTNLVSFNIPKHPQRQSRGEYLNVSPYSRYYLSFYPFCGKLEIDSAQLQGKTQLDLVYTVDLRTGKAILNICTEHSGDSYIDWRPYAPLQVIEAQVGVSMPLASIHTILPSSISQVVRNVALGASQEFSGFKDFLVKSEATAAKLIGGLLNLDEGAMNAVYDEIGAKPLTGSDVSNIATNTAAMSSTVELTGSQGTISLNSRMPIEFWALFYSVADEGNMTFGRPLCQQTALTNLTGFTQCAAPHINAPNGAFSSEIEAIETYLATGVILS